MPWCGPTEQKPYPSLGWWVLRFAYRYLPSPRDHDQPLIFTNEQARSIVEWYSVDIETGRRYIYRRGAARRSKGWGQSPREAVKAIVALVGNVVPDGFDANGEPVGRPWGTGNSPNPWVQIAAVSEDQTDNTYSVLHELLTANDGRAADELRIDVGLTRCFLRDRPGKLEPVTAAAGSREGQPVTDAVLDETHLWTPRNGGVKLANALKRNVSKMGGRSYETTNSFVPGEDSVAEKTHKSVVEKGATDIYYDAVEAPPVKEEDPNEKLREALAVAYGDSWWVDLDRIVADVRDPDTPWEDSCRFFFNWNVDDRLKAVETKRWGDLAGPSEEPPAGTRIALGFDGSISDDCTALIGCYELDGKPHTFEIEVWARPDNARRDWRIPRSDVQARVKEAFGHWDVGLMMCDPAKWQTEIEGWAEQFGDERVVFFDTNQTVRMARACDRFLTAIAEGAYSHDGAETLGKHVLAMHKRKVRIKDEDDDGRTKYVFVKGPDKLKIDAGIAAVLALEAFATTPESDPEPIPMAAWA
jgi:hypothetical protein